MSSFQPPPFRRGPVCLIALLRHALVFLLDDYYYSLVFATSSSKTKKDPLDEDVELKPSPRSGLGLFALRDFAAGQLLFEERAFFSFDPEKELAQPPKDKHNLAEFEKAWAVLKEGASKKGATASKKRKNASSAAMDALIALAAEEAFLRLSDSALRERWMDLSDAQLPQKQHLTHRLRPGAVAAVDPLQLENYFSADEDASSGGRRSRRGPLPPQIIPTGKGDVFFQILDEIMTNGAAGVDKKPTTRSSGDALGEGVVLRGRALVGLEGRVVREQLPEVIRESDDPDPDRFFHVSFPREHVEKHLSKPLRINTSSSDAGGDPPRPPSETVSSTTTSSTVASKNATPKSVALKERVTVLLPASVLKTPAGIFRTNFFAGGLFELRCRMNHVCRPNTRSERYGEKVRYGNRNKMALSKQFIRPMKNRHVHETWCSPAYADRRSTFDSFRGPHLYTGMARVRVCVSPSSSMCTIFYLPVALRPYVRPMDTGGRDSSPDLCLPR